MYFMDAKLTLKLNKETIRKAKKYAKENEVKFRGKNAAVTRASARTAFSVMEYDNSKMAVWEPLTQLQRKILPVPGCVLVPGRQATSPRWRRLPSVVHVRPAGSGPID